MSRTTPTFATFPADDEDAPYLPLLSEVRSRPVFVMGLHRSGTTFLYDCLCRVLPLAAVRVYHVFCYARLLSRHAQGTAHADRDALAAHFRAAGLTTREVDAIALSPRTVEEYGWILQKNAGRFVLDGRTQPTFDALLRKIAFLEPAAQGVAFKNPWDTGRAAQLRGLYPDARFVFIARDPVRILHSQFKNALLFGGTDAPYLHMLLEGFPLGRLVIGAQRRLHRLVGERRYGRIMLRVVMGDIRRELARYQTSWAALPQEARIEVTYPQLTQRPAETLARIAEFLSLDPIAPLESVEPRPRVGPVHDEVARVRDRFLAGLRARELLRDL